MMMQGHSLPQTILSEAQGADRFWFWRGASGRKYIHSIYAMGQCPPVPGAVYVAVRGVGSQRRAVAVGRFASVWDDDWSLFHRVKADEVHVHLLARDHAHAEAILGDLKTAFAASPQLVRAA
jgi:hypothetical protein